MSDKRFELTRRKALLGLGSIGLAGAGAGLGTSALFSDEETFESNTIQAGTMDLSVTLELLDINPETKRNGLNASGSDLAAAGDTVTVNGDESEGVGTNGTFELSFNDVKPGDWWVLKWTVSIEGNPGYVGYRANNISQSKGQEPEPETSEATSDTGEGDLGTKIRVRAGDSYDTGSGAGIESGTTDAKDVQQGDTDTQTASNSDRAYATPKDISLNGDGGIRFGGQIADSSTAPYAANPLDLFFVGTLNHKLRSITSDLGATHYDPDLDQTISDLDYAEAYTFVNPFGDGSDSDSTADPDEGGQPGVNYGGAGPGLGSIRNSDDYTTLGTQNSPDAGSFSLVEKYFIPNEVGNVIMGDSISFEVEFLAEQARNSSSPSWLANDGDPDVSDT